MSLQETFDDIEQRVREKPFQSAVPILLLALVAAFPLLGIQNPASIYGSTLCADAVSESYVDSNAGTQYQDNTAFIVSTTTAGCGDQIVGGGIEIPASELQDGDIKAESSFIAQLSGYNAFFEQQIQDNKDAYQLQFRQIDCGFYCGSQNRETMEQWQNEADINLYQHMEVADLNGEPHLVGSRAVEQGEIKRLSSSTSTGFEANLQLCASGRCDTKTLTEDRNSVAFGVGSLDAEATHTGSLVGDIRNIDFRGTITPVESEGGRLFLTSPRVVDSYQQTLDNVASCLSSNADSGVNTVRTACGNSDELQNMYTSQNQIAENSLSFNGDVRVTQSHVRTVTNDPNTLETQQIRWTIGAEWLGLFNEKPEPRIGSVSDVEIGENSNRYVQIPVTNDGEGGDINVNVQCDPPISGGSQQQYVSSGSTSTFVVDISSGTGSSTGYSCTATATAVADASLSDSTRFTATLTDEGEVTPPPGPDPCEVNPDLPECEDDDGLPVIPIVLGVAVLGLLGAAYMFRDQIGQVISQ